ncbi:MAG: helix-turn-helix domain-containing protein [Shimia sp.]
MRHAKLATSARLQKVLAALRAAGGEVSTEEIIQRTGICAVNSAIAELRENGAKISCRQSNDPAHGSRVWFYTLEKEPPHDIPDAL